MDEIIIRESLSKVIKTIIFATINIFLCFWYFFNGTVNNMILNLILGILILLLCPLVLAFIIKNVIYKRVLLKIDNKGITDTATLSSIGFIDYNNIKSVYAFEKLKQKFLAIDLIDLHKVINNISPFKKFIIKFNLKLKYPVICINLDTSDMDLDEVLIIINDRLEDNLEP
ncbi:hypothetical protein SAMN02745941_00461 [Clostridium intestinale DSM 6191]|uniref:Uncharacterized protein n=2 Tax=Clostridium intestinale TaxID=36845 RepID=A0A1M5UAM1_9CLOT|nr:hypothetical protein SAMN02745941_00461 [Clostridium intestinale DSM 6191]